MNPSVPFVQRLREVLREPLLHFAAIGALLFGAEWLATRGGGEEPRRIVIDAALVHELAEDYEREVGHAPSEADLEARTQRWLEEEVLYREALAIGLDRDDPRIRRRLASKMAFVLERRRPVPKPTQEDLRDWFAEHAVDYGSPLRVDFTHVFVRGDDDAARLRAESLRKTLIDGAAPAGLGDSFSGGRRYRRRSLDDLERAFGESFTETLDEQTVGDWRIRSSRHGLHVVRVDAIHPPDEGDFEAQRLRVEQDWIDAKREVITREETAALLAGWEVVRP